MAISATAATIYDYTIFVKDTDNYSSTKIAMDSLKISDNGVLLILGFERWRAYQYWNGSEYRIGYNHFLMTDTSGNTSEFKYPEFSYSVKIDVDWLKVKEKEKTTEKEKCEDPWEGNVVSSCEQ